MMQIAVIKPAKLQACDGATCAIRLKRGF